MLHPSFTGQFKKDFKKTQKSGKSIEKVKMIMVKLVNQENLENKYRDHKLAGNFKDRRECHVEPDLLIIYKIDENEIIFERMGTHSELFE